MFKWLLKLFSKKKNDKPFVNTKYEVEIIHFHREYYKVRVRVPGSLKWRTVYNALYNTIDGAIWNPVLITAGSAEDFIKNNLATFEMYNEFLKKEDDLYSENKKHYTNYLNKTKPFYSKKIV